METDMKIGKVKKRKGELASEILTLIRDFEKETECSVVAVDLEREHYISADRKDTTGVWIKVEV